jgi:DNA-binding Lrp family transcriptional regulator
MMIDMRAYVLLTTRPGTSEAVVNAIKAARGVKGVVDADSLYGRYDAIVVIEAEDLQTTSKIIYTVIEKIPNIVRTETMLTVF